MQDLNKFIIDNFGIDKKVLDFCLEKEELIKDRFAEIDRITEYNQLKVLRAMQKNNLSDVHFSATTGYGYNDLGRDTLEKIYADIFNTEDFQSGIRIKNYKFIIVQEINIYDQIKKNYPELFNNSIIEEEIDSNNKTINIVYIIGFVLVISYLLTIFLLMTVFNIILAEIDNEENN